MVSLALTNFRVMKKIVMLLLVFTAMVSCKNKIKNTKEISKLFIDSTLVKKHLYTLASNEMEGRKAGTPGIEKAAQYIEKEFKTIGLVPYDTLSNYRQTFTFKNRRTQEDITSRILLECWKEKVKKRRLLLYLHIMII